MTANFGHGRRRRQPARAVLYWGLATYAFFVVLLVALVLGLRQTTLREMDTPRARAQWEIWREAEPNRSDRGPVRRRPPSSVEPPALLLMRDHFAVVMSGAILFGSLLFAAIFLAVRGTLASSRVYPDALDESSERDSPKRSSA